MEHQIRHVAVIGSGVMGGGIAAHVANAGLPVTLLDIAPFKLTPQEEAQGLGLNDPKVKNRIVMQGFQGIVKGKPPALFSRTKAELI
ncbi:MAG: 3-hydroxyacyl-CoA dehydrogenase NAD-binding domain-containing protein, partial [Pseudomonadota bacterium]